MSVMTFILSKCSKSFFSHLETFFALKEKEKAVMNMKNIFLQVLPNAQNVSNLLAVKITKTI